MGVDAISFAAMNEELRRRLRIVMAGSLGMFLVEMIAGQIAGSQSLEADSLDFFADGVTAAIAFWAIGKPLHPRLIVALAKGAGFVLLGAWVGATTLYHFFVQGLPDTGTMAVIGVIAACANGAALWLLLPNRDTDAIIHAAWYRARNDGIGNVAVIVAAGLVLALGSQAPDLVVAGVMVALFLTSAVQLLRQANAAWVESRIASAAGRSGRGPE